MVKKIKKWSRPDLAGKPMNKQFQLYNLYRLLDSEYSGLIFRVFDEKLHLPENLKQIKEYPKQFLSYF